MYRYYCIMRPPAPGAIPKGAVGVKVYPERKYIAEIDRMAWGWVKYDEPLSCDDVHNYELVAKPRDTCGITSSDLAFERGMMYNYIKLNAHRLPRYWQKKGTKVCIDGICCMLARGTFSLEAIADLYECSVMLVKQINCVYAKKIAKYAEEYKDCAEQLGKRYQSNQPDKYNDDGFISLIRRIFDQNYEDNNDEN